MSIYEDLEMGISKCAKNVSKSEYLKVEPKINRVLSLLLRAAQSTDN